MTEALFVGPLLGGDACMWLLFLMPAIIAFRRHHPERWVILSLNLFLGATGVGWLGALGSVSVLKS